MVERAFFGDTTVGLCLSDHRPVADSQIRHLVVLEKRGDLFLGRLFLEDFVFKVVDESPQHGLELFQFEFVLAAHALVAQLSHFVHE